ncbi:MAG: glucose-1-phosphate adenylyltransferase subunit GlgD [Thermotogaceae bacterium]|nr:glucose-1-phosphate adenylyltransferase subunit GlgD [Thermotogaceae bacterium]
MKVLGLILAGGKSDQLGVLTSKRASAAMPVFGKYRAIDFTLSNMVNSGIIKVGVLTQYNPRSLMDHLGSGKEWDLDRKTGGLFILQPYISPEGSYWYRGTADAIYQNMTLLRRGEEDFVLIGSGDHIYKINFGDVFRFHFQKGADVTLIVKDLDESYDLTKYGIVDMDEDGRIYKIEEKPENPQGRTAFLGIYFINKYLLMDLLYSFVPGGATDLLLDVIIPNLNKLKVYGYKFNGYWRNIKKSVYEYYRTNMDILNESVRDELFYKNGKVYTKLKDLPPPKFTGTAAVENSLISDGTIITGRVRNSVIFRGVKIRAGAVVENSIIMESTVIEEGAVVYNAVLDKESVVREEKKVIGDKEILVFEKRAVI